MKCAHRKLVVHDENAKRHGWARDERDCWCRPVAVCPVCRADDFDARVLSVADRRDLREWAADDVLLN